ncbi:hypothetical protein BJ170DRAFT_190905 [Xylariales sp. AK1849]|nr:hypothetical protein BJ170DRAFT_190905 [Xylariales sp. AK1849]
MEPPEIKPLQEIPKPRDIESAVVSNPPSSPSSASPDAGAATRPIGVVQARGFEIPAIFRSNLFAEKQTLSWWFPSIKDDERHSWRIWLSRRSRALLMQVTLVTIIFVTNLTLTVFTVSQYKSANGIGLIYDDDCETVKKLDQWIHLLINLLSTGMLSASNYCMQLLAAPTRDDVDRAHHANRWLDIGVPSLRNLRYISGWRRFTWILLAFSSLPIHLVYNSAVFQSLASNDYTIAVVKDSFVHGSSWSLATAERNRQGDHGWDDWRVNPKQDYQTVISDIQHAAVGGSYEERNTSACFDLYDDYFAPQGNAVVLVKNQSVQVADDDSLLMYVSVIPRQDDWAKNLWAVGNGTGAFVATSPGYPVTTWYLGPPRFEVSHCLVQPPNSTTSRCRFEYSPPIMFTVCILNFLKASVMFCVWVMRKWQKKDQDTRERHQHASQDHQHPMPRTEVIYTLGDAIASFMRDPDPTTKDMCLATKHDFVSRRLWSKHWVKQWPSPSREPREWRPEPKLWMSAASLKRWLILLFVCCLVIFITGILLGLSFRSLKHRRISTSVPDLWDLGFGSLTQYTYLVVGLPREDPAGLISNVFLANLPQLVLSILYLFYNSMLSTFLVQREFSHMHSERKRKTLRVSEPIGIQRSSYFISLPLRYGIPVYATSGIMHWLISQSLFLARTPETGPKDSRILASLAYLDSLLTPDVAVKALDPNGAQDDVNSFSTCGYSPIAIIITMILGFTLVVAIVLVGCRKYDGTMRLVATNSRAISAACHVPAEDQADGYLLPVRWGVVEIKGDGIGHCAFTTAPDHSMEQLREGGRYR